MKKIIYIIMLIMLPFVVNALQFNDGSFYYSTDTSSRSSDVVLNMPFSSVNYATNTTTDYSLSGNTGTMVGYTFNHGTLIGLVNITETGYKGKGMNVTAKSTNNYLNITDALSTTDLSKGTIAFRVYIDNITTTQTVLGFGNDTNNRFTINVLTNPLIGIYLKNNGSFKIADTDSVPTRNSWNTLIFTWTGSAMTMYVNGVSNSVTNTDLTFMKSIPNLKFYVGKDVINDNCNYTFDSIRVYNRALSASEVANIYANESNEALIGDGLIASYSFENYNSSTVFDTNNLVSDGRGGNAQRFNKNSAVWINSINQSTISTGTSWTTSLWFNANSINYVANYNGNNLGSVLLIGFNGNEYSLFFSSVSNNILFSTYNGSYNNLASNTVNFGLNRWYNVVAICDSNVGMKLYINGVLDNSNNNKNCRPRLNAAKVMSVGGDEYYKYNNSFNGSISDVRVFNRSLSASEVAKLYATTRGNYDYAGSLGYLLRAPVFTLTCTASGCV